MMWVFGSELADWGGGDQCGGGVGRGKRAGNFFGRERVWFGVCKFADGNLVTHTGLDMYRLAMATKADVTNLPRLGGLKRRWLWARLGSSASPWLWQ